METYTVAERTTRKYTALLRDENGALLPLAGITTITLTLYERITKAIINSRNAQDVKNANGVTIGVTDGTLAWIMDPLDNAIVGTTAVPAQEDHIALFQWTYPTGKRGQHEILFIVSNSNKVP